MSVFRDMALDAGYRGEEAAQAAAMLEQREYERACAEAEEHERETFPYLWHWHPRTWGRWQEFGAPMSRKDQPCRVICRGTMNSALVEFADGQRAVVSRNGLRRRA